MSEIRDEPAFPTTQYADGISPSGHGQGMSIRDYFAIHATDGDISYYLHHCDTREEARYAFADTMLIVRAENE
jgi:hypothetical protein